MKTTYLSRTVVASQSVISRLVGGWGGAPPSLLLTSASSPRGAISRPVQP